MAVEYWGCGVRHIQVLLLILCEITEHNMQQTIRLSLIMVDAQSTSNYTLFDDPYRQIVRTWNSHQKVILIDSWNVLGFMSMFISGWLTMKVNLKYFLLVIIFLVTAIQYCIPSVVVFGNYDAILAISLILGFFHGLKAPVVMALLARWTPQCELSRSIPLVFTSVHVSHLTLLFVYAFLKDSPASWTSIYYLIGNLGILWCVGWYTFGYPSPEKCFYVSAREKNYIYANIQINLSGRDLPVPWARLFKNPQFYGVLIPTILFKWFYDFINQSTVRQSYQYAKGTPYRFSMYVSYFASLAIVPLVQFLIGFMGDAVVARRKYPPRFVRKTCNSISFWGGCVCLLFVAYNTSVVFDMISFSLYVHYSSAYFQGAHLNFFDIERTWSGFVYGLVNFVALIPLAFVNSMYPQVFKPQGPGQYTDEMDASYDVLWIIGALSLFFGNFVYIIIAGDLKNPMVTAEEPQAKTSQS